MSAKVDFANIAADRGHSLFANASCRSSGTVVQNEGSCSAASFNGSRSLCTSNETEREKSPEVPDCQQHACSQRHHSFSTVERHIASKQRRHSDKFSAGVVAFNHRRRGGRMGRFHAAERLRERIVLPTRFLLGGNITDPLNLNSLCDDEVNRSMNETTPISSPVPIPMHRLEVKVLRPVNSADPLNLSVADGDNSTEIKPSSLPRSAFRRRRKRNRQKKRKIVHEEQHLPSEQMIFESSLQVDVSSKDDMQLDKPADDTAADLSARHKRVIDHIVSPVIPQKTSKWKRRRTASESRTETVTEDKLREMLDGVKAEKALTRHKKRNLSVQMVGPRIPVHFRANDQKFSHGSYSGNGTILGAYEDHRLAYFSHELFSGKDILDIGCGVGHVSLCLARDFGARQVVGLDSDQKVINSALKNKCYYASAVLPNVERFPLAIRRRLGPLVAPPLLPSSDVFPHNVTFSVVIYVLVVLAFCTIFDKMLVKKTKLDKCIVPLTLFQNEIQICQINFLYCLVSVWLWMFLIELVEVSQVTGCLMTG